MTLPQKLYIAAFFVALSVCVAMFCSTGVLIAAAALGVRP